MRAFRHLAIAFAAHAGAMSSQLRIGRISLTGNYYSITTVTAQRSPCFVDPTLAALMMEQLEQCDRSGLTRSFACAFMPDHLHWVMQLKEGTLSRCVQSLQVGEYPWAWCRWPLS